MNDQQRSFAIQTFIATLILNGILLGLIYYYGGNLIEPILFFGASGVISLILWLVIVFIGNRLIADAARDATPIQPTVPPARETPRPIEPKPEPTPVPPPLPALPSDAPAIQMLAILQRRGRLIDFLQENLSGYDDAQIGAAVRTIHAGCREALLEHVTMEPIYSESEGSQVTVDTGFDANAVRLVGNVTGQPPFRGTLVHRGWRVAKLDLPRQTSDKEKVIAPAEVEI